MGKVCKVGSKATVVETREEEIFLSLGMPPGFKKPTLFIIVGGETVGVTISKKSAYKLIEKMGLPIEG